MSIQRVMSPFLLFPSLAALPPAGADIIPGHRFAQDKRLPLHYAAEKSATLEVVELLLGAESKTATAAAADEARRCANAPHAARALSHHIGPSCLQCSIDPAILPVLWAPWPRLCRVRPSTYIGRKAAAPLRRREGRGAGDDEAAARRQPRCTQHRGQRTLAARTHKHTRSPQTDNA